MADNAGDAIRYVNANQGRLWVPTYKTYIANVYHEAAKVDHDVRTYEEYAKVHAEDLQLQKTLNTMKGS